MHANSEPDRSHAHPPLPRSPVPVALVPVAPAPADFPAADRVSRRGGSVRKAILDDATRKKSEAPACMRCRGLSRPRVAARSTLHAMKTTARSSSTSLTVRRVAPLGRSLGVSLACVRMTCSPVREARSPGPAFRLAPGPHLRRLPVAVLPGRPRCVATGCPATSTLGPRWLGAGCPPLSLSGLPLPVDRLPGHRQSEVFACGLRCRWRE